VQLGTNLMLGYLLFASLAGAPFVLIAVRGVTAPAAWLTGSATTALIWGFLFVAMVLERPVNSLELGIGAGVVVLGSPVLVGAIIWAVSANPFLKTTRQHH